MIDPHESPFCLFHHHIITPHRIRRARDRNKPTITMITSFLSVLKNPERKTSRERGRGAEGGRLTSHHYMYSSRAVFGRQGTKQ